LSDIIVVLRLAQDPLKKLLTIRGWRVKPAITNGQPRF